MSEQEQDSLTLVSYKSTGFNLQRGEFVCDLLQEIGRESCILALQEHFIFEKNLAKIEKLLPNDLIVYSIGSFKDCSNIKRGRGLSFIWHRSFDHIISRIQVQKNDRIQCISVDLPGCKLLLVNVYFPQDSQTRNFDEQELQRCLASIQHILENSQFDQSIILGDFNCDFTRNSRFVEIVTNFI